MVAEFEKLFYRIDDNIEGTITFARGMELNYIFFRK